MFTTSLLKTNYLMKINDLVITVGYKSAATINHYVITSGFKNVVTIIRLVVISSEVVRMWFGGRKGIQLVKSILFHFFQMEGSISNH